MRVSMVVLLMGIWGCSKAPVELVHSPVATPEPTTPTHVPQDEYNLRELERTRKGPPGLARDLASVHFKHGDKLSDVTAAYKPDVLFEHGPYSTAVYANGMYISSLDRVFVIAKRGRLVRAFGSGCVWRPVFFDGMPEAERREWSEGYQTAHREYVEAYSKRFLHQRASLAVAGPISAVLFPTEW
jgi:hypothetical protein